MKPVIYQLVVRYFSNTNTTNQIDGTLAINGSGKFADITPAALASLRALGATHVWLTGCLRQATLSDYSHLGLPPDHPDVVKGIAGSLYAIRDYFDVCPDYAINPANRLAEFDALIQRVHDAGLRAIIDLVPNHVARGYHSVVNPEVEIGDGDDTSLFFHPANHFFYVLDPPGQRLQLARPESWNPPGITFTGDYPPENPPKVTGNNAATASPGVGDWYETVKLNYGYNFIDGSQHYLPRPRTWDLVNQVIAYWQSRGVDGFRCDFAHYVPPEAWAFLIARARRRNPAVFFFAEAYPWEGSGDPVTDVRQLLDVGFDAVYQNDSYNRLKHVYQGTGTQDDYDHAMSFITPETRRHVVTYLENHDERRIPSPVDRDRGPGDSGFGSVDANYLLAPLQFLFGPGPVLLFNGQEVGEPAVGAPGYSGDDGRTTLFDYWCMPEFARWVNGHAYDGGQLSPDQRHLRRFYADLLELCQDPCVRGEGYWGLKYHNRPDHFLDSADDVYTFARYDTGRGRLLLIAGNFSLDHPVDTLIRIPTELATACGLNHQLTVTLRLNRNGATDDRVARISRDTLIADGFPAHVPLQTAHVYLIA